MAADKHENQDVVALILKDHRTMEDLFRRMRSVEANRADALATFSALLVAHGEAEESEVYGALKRFKDVDNEEVEHGAEEHAEGNEALLALLEVAEASEVGSDEWDARLEDLVKAVSHHLDEEERTILNGARENVPDERRAELGAAFLRERERHLAAGCGGIENVRAVVRGA
ncbi:hemerythrin domain-containing protein [Streptomyces sp. 4.24]|uniref:hemerythrin domain-containing protein n=1 Tax=Streptomyces tritrimontium TaxID=3406573 RepID=UPI003BB62270